MSKTLFDFSNINNSIIKLIILYYFILIFLIYHNYKNVFINFSYKDWNSKSNLFTKSLFKEFVSK